VFGGNFLLKRGRGKLTRDQKEELLEEREGGVGVDGDDWTFLTYAAKTGSMQCKIVRGRKVI